MFSLVLPVFVHIRSGSVCTGTDKKEGFVSQCAAELVTAGLVAACTNETD